MARRVKCKLCREWYTLKSRTVNGTTRRAPAYMHHGYCTPECHEQAVEWGLAQAIVQTRPRDEPMKDPYYYDNLSKDVRHVGIV